MQTKSYGQKTNEKNSVGLVSLFFTAQDGRSQFTSAFITSSGRSLDRRDQEYAGKTFPQVELVPLAV